MIRDDAQLTNADSVFASFCRSEATAALTGTE